MGCTIQSKLPAKAYMAALKGTFGFPLATFRERVTGIAIGRFFSVAYHSPWEWNRRITSECNRAMGYVKEVDGKAQVHFVRSKGMLSPFWLIFWTLFSYVAFLHVGGDNPIWSWLISAVISVVLCLISAFESSITDAGEEGAGIVTDLLQAPDEFYYC